MGFSALPIPSIPRIRKETIQGISAKKKGMAGAIPFGFGVLGLLAGGPAGIYCTLLMTPTPVVPLAPVPVVNGESVTGVRVTAPPETATV